GGRAGEGVLAGLGVAPDHKARTAGEGATGDVPAGEGRGERLAMVDGVPADVAAVEGVVAGRGGRRVGERSLNVDQRIAVGEVLAGVDVEVVAPEDVLEGDVGGEVVDVAGQTQGAVVHRVNRDVA